MTKSSSFLSKLAKRIHPPLLTTPKDSARLLKGLQQSFRDQLDREHPSPEENHRKPIDSHVNAVITSPLFGRAITPTSIRQESLLAPFEYFQHEVATGNATLDTAKECLSTGVLRHRIPKDSTSNEQRNLLVKCIMQWLWSSGLEESMEFAHDTKFLDLLLTNLSTEARLACATKWYENLSTILMERLHTSSSSHLELLPPMAYLFKKLALYRRSTVTLGAIVGDFNVASKKINQELSSQIKRLILNRALISLVHVILRTKRAHDIDLIAYTELMSISKQYQRSNSWAVSVLALKHPQKPTASVSLSFLDTLSIESLEGMEPNKRARVLDLASETVGSLITTGETAKAQTLLDRFHVPSVLEKSKASPGSQLVLSKLQPTFDNT